MKPKSFVLENRGMNRDLSVSKTGKSSAFDNHNIRIEARENDTLLSITNERGTKTTEITFPVGKVIGWNSQDNHIIVFYLVTGQEEQSQIYRIDYENGAYDKILLYASTVLHFSAEHPIESVIYVETEEIQKIYWVDGIHPLRFMNYMADAAERGTWSTADDTIFDVNRSVDSIVDASVSKAYDGTARANGVTQYIMTYFDRYGAESGCVWLSDIIYLSPKDRGGSADDTNTCVVTIKADNLDSKFSYARVYSLFRSSLNGTVVAYVVGESEIDDGSVTIIDDGAHLAVEDVGRLLFLGGRAVVPGTLAHKDNTLFLGNLTTEEAENYDAFEQLLRSTYVRNNHLCNYQYVQFLYSANPNGAYSVELKKKNGIYPYDVTLDLSSGQISTFKGGETYRLALQFQKRNGEFTNAFWIGDITNNLYPIIDTRNGAASIKRPIVRVTITPDIAEEMQRLGFISVRLMRAEATLADRTVVAQGVVNPTMFNTFERYNKRIHTIPSWLIRPRQSKLACKHFEPVKNSSSSWGEIQCNYWADEDEMPVPYFRLKNVHNGNWEYITDYGYSELLDADALMVIYKVRASQTFGYSYSGEVYYLKIKASNSSSLATAMRQVFTYSHVDQTRFSVAGEEITLVEGSNYTIKACRSGDRAGSGSGRGSMYDLHSKMIAFLNSKNIPEDYYVRLDRFCSYWCEEVAAHSGVDDIEAGEIFYRPVYFNDTMDDAYDFYESGLVGALNAQTQDYSSPADVSDARKNNRWYLINKDARSVSDSINYMPAYHYKHIMFVDENTVTLNSPEFDYGNVSSLSDSYHFRLVGVSKISSSYADYTVDASQGNLSGQNLQTIGFQFSDNYGRIDGLTAFPLWSEHDLDVKPEKQDVEVIERWPEDYQGYASSYVTYWLYMWHKSGNITGFNPIDDVDYSVLRKKTFANMHFSYNTIYNNAFRINPTNGEHYAFGHMNLATDAIRFNLYPNSTFDTLPGIQSGEIYSPAPEMLLQPKTGSRYPILFSRSVYDTGNEQSGETQLYTDTPIVLSFAQDTHAVIKLHEETDDVADVFTQTILPYVLQDETDICSIPSSLPAEDITGALLPWVSKKSATDNPETYVIFKGSDTAGGEMKNITFNFDSTYVQGNIILGAYCQCSYVAWSLMKKAYEDEQLAQSFLFCANVITGQRQGYFVARFHDTVTFQHDTTSNTYSFSSRLEIVQEYDSLVAESEWYKKAKLVFSASLIPGYAFILPANDTLYDIQFISGGYKASYLLYDYQVSQGEYPIESRNNEYYGNETVRSGDRYLFIGEIYKDVLPEQRYGGTDDSAIERNRFLPAGKFYPINDIDTILGTQGDTFFQRYDFVKTKPKDGSINNVIDVTSVMLETHVNLDGRTSPLRKNTFLASVDTTELTALNSVYSQQDNFVTARDMVEEYKYRNYPSSITWTLPKADLAIIDEWTRINLAAALTIDADKGPINALRRFRNSLVAFQDKGIAEILFNSRTQLSTNEGVPVEIANSGKVDGKRYLSEHYGCTNKWSIVQGKMGLYFIDNINKAFCVSSYDNRGALSVNDLSEQFGMSAWFKKVNTLKPWSPADTENFIAFYDKVHSDIYLVGHRTTEDAPTLVFSETLGAFSSFYDYEDVDMLVNVHDKFVAIHGGELWRMHEGKYGEFFGTVYPFWVHYRVAPGNGIDRIWTNIDYNADFYKVLDSSGDILNGHEDVVEMISPDYYQQDETFDVLKVWNEYQTTGDYVVKPKKKFRTWRYAIPRALSSTGRYSLDRIRNPWVNIKLTKNYIASGHNNEDLMQLHNIEVTYYE